MTPAHGQVEGVLDDPVATFFADLAYLVAYLLTV